MLIATAAARYGAGQGDREALAKIELERSGLDEREADVVADRTALVATLNRLTGRDDTGDIGSVDALPDTVPFPEVGRRLRCSACGGKQSVAMPSSPAP